MSFYQLKLAFQACLCFDNFSHLSLQKRGTSSVYSNSHKHFQISKKKQYETNGFTKKIGMSVKLSIFLAFLSNNCYLTFSDLQCQAKN